MGELVVRYWLALAIAGTVFLAWLSPAPALLLPKLYLLDAGVITIMFMGSLKLTPSRFKEAAANPHLPLLALVQTFAVAPVVSLLIAYVFGFRTSEDQIAVLICSTQASTLATGIVLTEVADGDVALAMVITVFNNIATVFLTPLAFRLLADTAIEVDYRAMASEIAVKIVLPVFVAQAVRKPLSGFVKRNSRKMSIVSQLIILMYIYAGVAAGIEKLGGQGDILPRIIMIVVSLHFALLVINAVVSRLAVKTPEGRTAFVLCSSQKTLPAAMIIWKGYFPGLPLGPIVAVSYHLTQLVVDSILAPGFKRLPIVRKRQVSGSEGRYDKS